MVLPITIEVRGRTEPIDCKKVAASSIEGEKLYFLVTADDRIASVNEKDVLVYWENLPTKQALAHVDELIEAGTNNLMKQNIKYDGVEAQ